MNQIWKYELGPSGTTTICMPKNAVVLYVAEQDKKVCLWALIQGGAQTVERSFRIVLTGEPFGADLYLYIGTVMLGGGSYVCHVFECYPGERS